ncbi:MAG: amidase [Nannocystis sp.]|nr:amidase [Nannocystis sp.]MBA3546196.1 amidase [Nannocystis sp.]
MTTETTGTAATAASIEAVLVGTASEQARLLRRGELSARELTAAALARIARINPGVTAFVEVLTRSARWSADACDREIARARRRGQVDALAPFCGVPTAVKDLNFVRGARTRFGSRNFPRLWSPFDDRTAAQLRRGGFVLLGKLATSEFGAMPVTEPDIHPPTRNPWMPGHAAGGSSGGSGAAVASGMIAVAQGSDGAGSIRIPAAFCGLYGLKPSRGRVANAYGLPDRGILYTCGPLTRSVDDAAAMLDVMAGLSVGKPHWLPRPAIPYAEAARRPPKGLRIRVALTAPIATPVHPLWRAATEAAAQLLADAGHQVEFKAMSAGTVDEFIPLYQNIVAGVPSARLELLQPATRWLVEHGRQVSAARARKIFLELSHRVHAWVGDADLVLTPTVFGPPPAVGAWSALSGEAAFRAAAEYGAFTAVFNLSGQPAASVPVGRSPEGFPIGVQVVGRETRDDLVLAVSRQLEQAFVWGPRVAPSA